MLGASNPSSTAASGSDNTALIAAIVIGATIIAVAIVITVVLVIRSKDNKS